MNNEIGRKLTSFTLMAIMVAGGMTVAAPGFMPAAQAQSSNPNLFVSAEDSRFDNYFGGPQVIEVVINDPGISDTDSGTGEPDVTINGEKLATVQGTDGNWYAYFADLNMANKADGIVSVPGTGLDFGTINNPNIQASDAEAIASGENLNVVREAKDRNGNNNNHVSDQSWPFVQLYEFNPTGNVNISYNKGGGAQSVTLTFDTIGGHGVEFDREVYPQGAQLHATITDAWLNIDPTDVDSWTFATNEESMEGIKTFYQLVDDNGVKGDKSPTDVDITDSLGDLMCDENCNITINPNTQGAGNDVIQFQGNSNTTTFDDGIEVMGDAQMGIPQQTIRDAFKVTITETGPNAKTFGTYDESDTSTIYINGDAARNTSATFDYNDSTSSVLVGHYFATIDIMPVDDTWNSGETIPIVIVDGDANKNSRADEDLVVSDPNASLIPALVTGDPFTLGEGQDESKDLPRVILQNATIQDGRLLPQGNPISTNTNVQAFSERAMITPTGSGTVNSMLIELGTNVGDLTSTLDDAETVFNFYNQDVGSFSDGSFNIYVLYSDGATTVPNTQAIMIAEGVDAQSGLVQIDRETITKLNDAGSDMNIGLAIMTGSTDVTEGDTLPIVADFFSYGFTNTGEAGGDRVSNQIIRIEVEESGDNTNTFEGALEYVMINQLNINDVSTYEGLTTIADDPTFIAIEDLTDEDSIRVTYFDLGSDGVSTQISDQQEAPSHSGKVSFDNDNYKIADTVTITLEDADLNVDSDLIDIYTIDNTIRDTVGKFQGIKLNTGDLGRVLDVTFDDTTWVAPVPGTCTNGAGDLLEDIADAGLAATGFNLVETGVDSGIFRGDFQIPSYWCPDASQFKLDTTTGVITDTTTGNTIYTPTGEEPYPRIPIESTTGLDIEVNYVDFRDASGEIIEVGDGAGIRANTGSVSLDRTVYPVPFGVTEDFEDNDSSSPDGRSVFPIHQTGIEDSDSLDDDEYLSNGDLTIHVRVNDPDFDVSAAGEDAIATGVVGPVKVSVIRGASTVVLTTAGGSSPSDGKITTGEDPISGTTPEFGPIVEIAPDAGIFEADITVRYTDGPASSQCPESSDDTINDRFAEPDRYCILQGDILQVEYTDPTDASGEQNSVTDSATFDLRNGVLQSDKSVYVIGSDIILTLIEKDFDLDNDQAETYDLDLIEWDSDAATLTLGSDSAFDPEPSDFRETGDSTGVFHVILEMPGELQGDRLERGEEIELEYTDWGPAGSDYVGDEDEDVNLTIFTSNFGATVELDQKIYTWTDKVYITIVAPDHNFDSNLVDEIGDTSSDPIKVSTRSADLDNYKLVETGTDTGIFTGEVILTGFPHDADGDTQTGDDNGYDKGEITTPRGTGPTDGLLPADDDDGLSVAFEFSEDETIVGTAIIRWNIGEVQWLESSYPATGVGVVRVIDSDMNLNPEAVDNFTVDVWSESDSGGIDLTVTETNESTGIFEGTVSFTVVDESSGHRLRVAENDTITAEYEDNTLPEPYSTADELEVTATSLIGTVVAALDRAPASNLRVVDAFNNSLDTVSVDQQVQVTADLTNGQDKDQMFAYLMQIQDESGVTVALDWISGTLSPSQSFSAAKSWIPTEAGTYTATVFVWESVDTPTALSPPLETTITVN